MGKTIVGAHLQEKLHCLLVDVRPSIPLGTATMRHNLY
jgi:hypothetical protein